ncbi:hypothetical protein BJF81_11875 [Ornithinimicrobium sp. CNJ-824]|uniref:hypothetical protein n=1 Tax=Ornithinimicrobium sp. CNJ-824 TaxID=1904966 RepID=UPI000964277D|nr:hypothetical protein [Ornithinimicrobium sp. CNJ-824]OLT23073.1 hypothetical protein BJF81_11875 [Ornithinimicrobium sp. CNJ-824]
MPPVPARRPRITPSAHVAGAVSTVAGVLALAAAVSPAVLTFALAAAVVALAWGWAGALALPTPRGSLGVIVVGGLALVLAVGTRPDPPWLVWVPAALSISMIAAFAHQLFRRDGRPRLVVSVSSVVLALTLVAVGVLLVPPAHTADGTALVLGALAAAVASAGTDLLGRWPGLRGWLVPLAMVGGGAAAVLVALLLDVPWTTWLLVGVVSAALSQAVRAVLAPLPTLALPRPRLVTAIASVLVVGAVPYLVALALVPDAVA